MTEHVVNRESFAARIWRKTLDGVGVKVGLAWVALLVFAAVFAPFLANSMPLLMSKGGVISAPVFQYLSVEDAGILVTFFIALAVYCLPLGTSQTYSVVCAGNASCRCASQCVCQTAGAGDLR